MRRHTAAAAQERCGREGGRGKKAGEGEGNEEEEPEESTEEAERWEHEGKRGWRGVERLSNTLHSQHSRCHILPGRVICGRLYLYPQCHFRANTSPECPHATLLQWGRLAVLSKESFYFISAIKCFTRLTYFFNSPFDGQHKMQALTAAGLHLSLQGRAWERGKWTKGTDWGVGAVKPVRLPWLPAVTAVKSAVHLEVACLRCWNKGQTGWASFNFSSACWCWSGLQKEGPLVVSQAFIPGLVFRVWHPPAYC